jgi:ATP-dependent HslUV protease ATP-binding subunit HslU
VAVLKQISFAHSLLKWVHKKLAQRSHFMQERILADISFSAPEKVEEARRTGLQRFHYVVDEEKVAGIMEPLLRKQDLSRYVL